MPHVTKSTKRLLQVGAVVALLGFFFPWIVGIFVVCGLIDVSRHGRWNAELLARYFAGNGVVTWLLSPLNLLIDLVSLGRPYRLELDDLPEAERAELEQVLAVFRTDRESILARLDAMMQGRRRGMLFFRWYDTVLDDSIPAFAGDLTWVKTIGVSAFNGQERTSLHFGPLRLTLRVLLNLTARQSDDIYIEVNGRRHFWHDDPLFIFDDTIQHRSVNDAEGIRYCVFIDILRPTRVPRLLNACVSVANVLMFRTRRVFYKNWDMLKAGG